MYVLGTAGHIDHGKSVLVHALTNIDPDRLREEKERGMTIDLGFAWLSLPGGREVGIVDVPGHERFIKNMLAGVGGIDLALLIVAANEGVMPQTREHLDILDLLRVRRGIIVVTKKDLVDDDWLSLVRLDIEELIAATFLETAPIIPVSAVNGEGLPELVTAIDTMLDTIEPRRDLGRPRLPIDRIFTISGSGTVVTGTLIDGSLTVGQEVEIVPRGLKARLRGLQTHKTAVNTAQPGSRVAANLTGVTTSRLERGDVITLPGWLKPTRILNVKLRLLTHLARPLRHNASVNCHLGASEVTARVRLLDQDQLAHGESGWAQLLLDQPVTAVNGDHFIIRSPMDTLGGGEIIEAHTKRLRRHRPAVIENLAARENGAPEDLITAYLDNHEPVEETAMPAGTGLTEEETTAAIENLLGDRGIVAIGTEGRRLLWSTGGWQKLAASAVTQAEEYHRKYPLRPGIPRVELVSRLRLNTRAAEVLQTLIDDGSLVERGANVSLPSFQVALTREQQANIDAFLQALAANPYNPPTDLTPAADLLNLLIDQEKVVKVGGNVIFSREAYEDMVARITALARDQGKITLAGVRDLLQTSRKYAQPLLEHLDQRKITRRIGDDRVLYK
jgi:selenocysteine-specific elongation factor